MEEAKPTVEAGKKLRFQIDGETAKSKPDSNKTREYWIVIDEQDNTDKNNNVLVTDGDKRQFYIPRGVKTKVPEGVVNVLRECVYDIEEPKGDGDTKNRLVPRYSFRVIGEA